MSVVLSVFSKIASLLHVASAWLKRVKDGIIKPVYTKIVSNKKVCWYLKLAERYTIVVLVFILVFQIGARYGQKKALATYTQWLEEYKVEQEFAAQEALAAQQESDPYLVQLKAEADEIARLLYGVRDNDTDDLKTYCWCVFNRVDNPAFPSTLEDVIAQPQQWMRYDKTNPIIESLWQLAREQLDAWHTMERRPCSSDFVFMSWSSDDIVLRDNYHTGSNCHYWRFGQ